MTLEISALIGAVTMLWLGLWWWKWDFPSTRVELAVLSVLAAERGSMSAISVVVKLHQTDYLPARLVPTATGCRFVLERLHQDGRVRRSLSANGQMFLYELARRKV